MEAVSASNANCLLQVRTVQQKTVQVLVNNFKLSPPVELELYAIKDRGTFAPLC